MSLSIGDRAPAIKSTDFSLASMKGKTVVVFFYPKSDTPGCTQESCDFRDLQAKFTKKNAEIVGISPDKTEAQQKFATKYGLPRLMAYGKKRPTTARPTWGLSGPLS
jgi:peroxiredoxin Q/BCP